MENLKTTKVPFTSSPLLVSKHRKKLSIQTTKLLESTNPQPSHLTRPFNSQGQSSRPPVPAANNTAPQPTAGKWTSIAHPISQQHAHEADKVEQMNLGSIHYPITHLHTA
ncbi:hypothetical protein HBH98_226470 [Parastagonospora nodorum]|nr:hypothetical protein HBH49_156960 [Parastagonospora nodorum]KAH4336537.1 hypothetical protein HBH98_226470 [Parastagonospora nodorum]KAH4365359.1 hypothetical protein HBH97_171320 [Parastagonospora nodorum]KAH4374736.1 hypothetical protein HBH99_221060 [Parastagonospora nodorum]KAH4920214.1 hypothetical protein HBI79_196520 [Parastagonospora nodorum]